MLGFVQARKLVVIPTAADGDSVPFAGFDWFLATLFILCDAHVADTCSVAHQIAQLPFASDLWALLNVKNASQELNLQSMNTALFCHQVEEIVADRVPLVASSFTLIGCTVSQVRYWTRCSERF